MAQRGLDPAQVAHYWDHGWVVVRGLFEKPDFENDPVLDEGAGAHLTHVACEPGDASTQCEKIYDEQEHDSTRWYRPLRGRPPSSGAVREHAVRPGQPDYAPPKGSRHAD